MSTSKNHHRKELRACANGELVVSEREPAKQMLDQVAPGVLQKLDRKDQNRLLKGFVCLQQRFHSGPIPSSEEMERYNLIIPDGANRIVAMAEKEQAHRIEMDKTMAPHDIKQNRQGQIFSFFFLPTSFLLGVWLTKTGFAIIGGMLIFFSALSVLSATIKQRKRS